MAILNLVLYPDDPLRLMAAPIEKVTVEHERLAADMFETMDAYEGVGLAGPQVGVSQRIFVVREPGGAAMCLINPEIIESEGREVGEEGCLSLPRIYADVPRASRVRVRGLNARGRRVEFEAWNFLARIIQHEVDHLDGVIFLDRVDVLTREVKLREWDEMRAQLLAPADKNA